MASHSSFHTGLVRAESIDRSHLSDNRLCLVVLESDVGVGVRIAGVDVTGLPRVGSGGAQRSQSGLCTTGIKQRDHNWAIAISYSHSCDGTSHVTQIDLSNFNLIGAVSFPSSPSANCSSMAFLFVLCISSIICTTRAHRCGAIVLGPAVPRPTNDLHVHNYLTGSLPEFNNHLQLTTRWVSTRCHVLHTPRSKPNARSRSSSGQRFACVALRCVRFPCIFCVAFLFCLARCAPPFCRSLCNGFLVVINCRSRRETTHSEGGNQRRQSRPRKRHHRQRDAKQSRPPASNQKVLIGVDGKRVAVWRVLSTFR